MTEATRDRILALVRQYPGLHQRELARQLDTSLALVQYHAKSLVDDDLLVIEEIEGTVRFFPRGMVADRQSIITLRDPRRLHIVLRLLEQGPLRHADLVVATGMGKSTLSFHLRRLEKARAIRKVDGVFQLVDDVAIRRLLDEHHPTPDLVDRFASLWEDMYG